MVKFFEKKMTQNRPKLDNKSCSKNIGETKKKKKFVQKFLKKNQGRKWRENLNKSVLGI